MLGFQGTMRAAALHWLRRRRLGGTRAKAPHGARRCRPPAGGVYDPAGPVVCAPDEEGHHAVRLLFPLVAQAGSALGGVQHCAEPPLRLPTRRWGKRQDTARRWAPLTPPRVLEVLHHPASAGASGYGRTQTRTRLLPGEAPRGKGRTRRVARQDWPLVLHAHHPASRTWEPCLWCQQPWDDNRTVRPADRPGAVRAGAALL